MEFDFDTHIDRRDTGSLKWQRYAGKDVLPLWVADMDFPVARPVLDAIRERLQHPILGYSVAPPSVNAAVQAYFQRDHGVEVAPEWLVWLPGMVPALAQTAAAVCERGQSIMICTPVYPPFRHVHRDLGLDLIQVPLRETQDPQGYTLDFEAMEAALRPDTKLLILCNPHNPVARVFSAAEIAQVGAFCLKHGLVLCSDEIHADLLLEPEIYPFTTALKVASELQQQLIVLHAASKTYNIPGMCCCYAVIPDEKLRTRFRAAKSTWVAEISPLGFAATEAAYRHGEPWRSAVRAYLRENRDLLANFLKSHAPHVRMPHMQATYLAWLDLRALGLEHPAAHFEAHGLGLSNGVDFGAPGHLRLNFACTRGMLREALERFGRAVAG